MLGIYGEPSARGYVSACTPQGFPDRLIMSAIAPTGFKAGWGLMWFAVIGS